MKLNSQIVKMIEKQMVSFRIERKSQLSRMTGISEPTIGRILAGKRANVSDPVAEKIAKFLNIPFEDLIIVAMGHSPGKKVDVLREPAGAPYYAISPEKIRRLGKWLESEANEMQRRVVLATASALGFQ